MQVQSRFPPGLPSHSSADHPHQVRVNGTHHPSSDPRAAYSPSASTTSPTRAGDMHSYQQYYPQQHQQPQQAPQQAQQHEQQQYSNGPPSAPPPQQRQYPANQLPPMFSTINAPPMTGLPVPGMPGVSSAASAAMFNPATQLHPQLGPSIQQHQPDPLRKRLSTTGSNGKYNFALKVEQQPMRARMCGFGDKDRRPITPPPCIKLVVTDMVGNPVYPEDLDGSFFVLQVDLWDESAQREVNIVRSSSNNPATSISSSSLTSYPPIPDRSAPQPGDFPQLMYTTNGQPIFAHPQPPYGSHPSMPYQPTYYGVPPMPPSTIPPHYGAYATGKSMESNNMYTRNLIGSLTVNASVLKDPSGTEDFWFVLQDLSVRTEGFFRLKMNFVDVGNPDGEGLNTGKAAVLASVYSDSFQVYSAKKFPGVIESTPLSKCFASQGIKIPIRKDIKPERDDEED